MRRFVYGFALLVLAGCRQNVDLDAVRQLSDKAANSQASFDLVAQDFHDTCVRKLRWDYFKAAARLLPPADPARIGSLDVTPYDSKRCDDALTLKAVERWKTFNRLLIGYFVALGGIAGAKSDSSAEGVEAFAQAVNRSGKFGSSEDVTTSANLLTSAIDDYFSYRRRNAISQFAGAEGSKFVEQTVTGLIAASATLDSSLDEEQQAVNDFYVEGYRHIKPGADVTPLLLTYRQNWSSDLAAVTARRNAIVAYQSAIRDLQASHETLVASIRANDPSALDSVVRMYLTEFDPLVLKLNEAFK